MGEDTFNHFILSSHVTVPERFYSKYTYLITDYFISPLYYTQSIIFLLLCKDGFHYL